MRIRGAEAGDVGALGELARATYGAAFGHSFEPGDLRAHLEKYLSGGAVRGWLERDRVLVAEDAGRMVGYVQVGTIGDGFPTAQSGDLELRRLYVATDRQGEGIGGALMAAVLELPEVRTAERLFLDVWEENPGAIRFYRQYGFEVVGSRGFEVESGAETGRDLLMVRTRQTSEEA